LEKGQRYVTSRGGADKRLWESHRNVLEKNKKNESRPAQIWKGNQKPEGMIRKINIKGRLAGKKKGGPCTTAWTQERWVEKASVQEMGGDVLLKKNPGWAKDHSEGAGSEFNPDRERGSKRRRGERASRKCLLYPTESETKRIIIQMVTWREGALKRGGA